MKTLMKASNYISNDDEYDSEPEYENDIEEFYRVSRTALPACVVCDVIRKESYTVSMPPWHRTKLLVVRSEP